ncbi:transporter [Bradyrhizobium sp. ma5]|uniref:SphA family protein n=1 Tax=Bradyrhizobium sp. ma5 TaxID=3344828 RepID=UPI0035D4F81E
MTRPKALRPTFALKRYGFATSSQITVALRERRFRQQLGWNAAGALFAAGSLLASCLPGQAYEAGYAGAATMPGITIGNASAGIPGPGLYGFSQTFTYQANVVGPGAPVINGNQTTARITSTALGMLWVPGWEFLGAKYDAVIVQPVVESDFGAPINVSKAGLKNTYIVPGELSWKLGDSGFFVKTGLGMHVPTGDTPGPAGLSSVGNPWWIYQPELLVSYLKDGWNITAAFSDEINTKNEITQYQTGQILHAEFAATKQLEKWTVGPVGYYVGQITADKSSAFYGGTINTNRYNAWAAGGLVGYDFGGAVLKVWAFQEFNVDASGGTPRGGRDSATFTQGWKVFCNLSFRLWAPDPPATDRRPAFFK